IFVEECVWVLHQKPQADSAHFVLELKLHVELDRVTAKSNVVRRITFVAEGQLEAKLLGVEPNRSLDVSRAENRMGLFEHCRLWRCDRGRCSPRRDSCIDASCLYARRRPPGDRMFIVVLST